MAHHPLASAVLRYHSREPDIVLALGVPVMRLHRAHELSVSEGAQPDTSEKTGSETA